MNVFEVLLAASVVFFVCALCQKFPLKYMFVGWLGLIGLFLIFACVACLWNFMVNAVARKIRGNNGQGTSEKEYKRKRNTCGGVKGEAP